MIKYKRKETIIFNLIPLNENCVKFNLQRHLYLDQKNNLCYFRILIRINLVGLTFFSDVDSCLQYCELNGH